MILNFDCCWLLDVGCLLFVGCFLCVGQIVLFFLPGSYPSIWGQPTQYKCLMVMLIFNSPIDVFRYLGQLIPTMKLIRKKIMKPISSCCWRATHRKIDDLFICSRILFLIFSLVCYILYICIMAHINTSPKEIILHCPILKLYFA